jgi:succinoglycan biosynthesis protein ExoA
MSEGLACRRTLVSVILPVFNEERLIESVLQSILDQEALDFDLEILVVDGNSRDGTTKTVSRTASADPRIRILVNEMQKTPYALNIGLCEAKGEYVCILGAHAIYDRDYISVCLGELMTHGAVGCSGRVMTRPANNTLQARLVAWAFAHPFGSSAKSFRTQREGFVDSVAYPVMFKKALLDSGGYNENLIRNQDNDMNQRLRAQGHKLFCTWKTQCNYYASGKYGKTLYYAFRNGFWNLLSHHENSSSMGVRHFVPFVFLSALIVLFVMATVGALLPVPYNNLLLIPLAGMMTLHLGLGLFAAIQISIREKSFGALCLPFVFLALHISYGAGTMCAWLTRARLPARTPTKSTNARSSTVSTRPRLLDLTKGGKP